MYPRQPIALVGTDLYLMRALVAVSKHFDMRHLPLG